MTPARFSALSLALLLSCAMPVKRTTAAPPPPADAQARALQDSLPDAVIYPAARLVALDGTSAEAMTIDSAFSQLEYVSHRGKPVADLVGGPADPESPRTWRKVEPHPYLSEVLPGVEFYSVVGRQGLRTGFVGSLSGEWLMARRQDQWYKMPEGLNQLLYDQGMRFTKADVRKWTRLSALVWAIVSRDHIHRVVIGDWDYADSTYWQLPAVPAVTFESVNVETAYTQAYMNGRVSITLDGAKVDLKLLAGERWFGNTANLRLGIILLSIGDSQYGSGIKMGPIKERDNSE